ncbi:MAG: bacillithiol biosynthesis cysteine-adding enzyme BshC [Gemmatimonadales bacterium]
MLTRRHPIGRAVRRSAPHPGGWDPALAPALLPGAEAAAARLAEPGALVVTTGQQPGLFGGPLSTLHKALSARGLARALERRWNRPVVPIFWVAGDDHDFAEGATASWFGADGRLDTGTLDPRPADAPMTPLAWEPMPAGVPALLERLGAALPPSPAREATLAWLGRHYRDGHTLGGAFAGAMAELLGPLGIVCFDSTAPAAKQAAAPHLLRALDQAAALDGDLARRAAELEAAGHDPGVKVGDGAALVFLDGTLGRDRLTREGDGFATRRSGERLRRADLDRIAADAPDRLSPNVLLRPVVEAAILPTVAYLAGPGELRYLRLAEALYRPLGVPRQTPVPRWSGLVLERRVTRTLEKLDFRLEELLGPAAPLEQRLLRRLAPADFEPAFAELRHALQAGFARTAAVAQEIDPTLKTPADRAGVAALNGVADLEKRLLQAQKRRQGELIDQLGRARDAVLPGNQPQERVIGPAALLGRYGFDLLTDLAGHIDHWFAAALEAGQAPA